MREKPGVDPRKSQNAFPKTPLFRVGHSPLSLVRKKYQKSLKVDKSGHCFFGIVILTDKV